MVQVVEVVGQALSPLLKVVEAPVGAVAVQEVSRRSLRVALGLVQVVVWATPSRSP